MVLAMLAMLATTPNFLSAEHEAYSKINLMLQWEQSPLPYPDTNFGPLHTILLWLPHRLLGSTVLGGRLVTLLFGLGLLAPLFRLVHRHAGFAPAAGSLALAAWLYPLSVGSVVTLAEVPFVCCALLAIDLLDDLTRQPRASWGRLVGAAAAATAAAALRFEGWPLLALLAVFLLVARRWREAAAFAALTAIFPLVHMYVCWEVTGNPVSFLNVSADVSAVHAAQVPAIDRIWLLPQALGRTIGWPGLALAAIGAVLALVERKLLLPLVALALMLTLLEVKTIDASLDPTLLRYLSLIVALLALFVAVPVERLARRGGRQRVVALVLALAIGATTAGFSHANAMHQRLVLEPDREAYRFVARVRSELSPSDRVLLGSEYHPLIVVESGLGWEHFRRPTYDPNGRIDPAEMAALFASWRPTLVFQDHAETGFATALGLTDAAEVSLFGTLYRRVWREGRWSVFRREEGPS